MNVISRPIAGGKTTHAILQCCKYGAMLICFSEPEAKRINLLVKDNPMFKGFPGAISYHKCREKMLESPNGRAIVDDAEILLSKLLGAQVVGVTFNGPPVDILGDRLWATTPTMQ